MQITGTSLSPGRTPAAVAATWLTFLFSATFIAVGQDRILLFPASLAKSACYELVMLFRWGIDTLLVLFALHEARWLPSPLTQLTQSPAPDGAAGGARPHHSTLRLGPALAASGPRQVGQS